MPDTSELDDLAKMRSRFRAAEEAETLNRVAALESIEFYWGKQWADDIEAARRRDDRPCFTLNKLPAIAKQVLNEMRGDPPAIEIEAEGDGSDDDDAEAVQGLARRVETRSQATVAYEEAFKYVVVGGFSGSWRVRHDYMPMSMDQDLFIDPIWNPFSVYWDPSSLTLDKADARWCFVTLDLSVDEFHEQYPGSELSGLNDFSGLGNQAPGWLHKDGARVVEYFYIESEDATLVKLADGRVVWDDMIPKGAKVAKNKGKPVARPEKRKHAYVAHSNGIEWLRKAEELPTDDIPIVTVYGDRLLVGDDFRTKGLVDDLQEAARMFNYNSSAIAETMALGAKANWVATVEQIEQFMDVWKQANSRNIAVLPYKNIPNVPPPNKVSSEPPIQAMSAARAQSADDLRSISGVYDATQSPNGGEESGRAIFLRRRQAVTGNNNFRGNLAHGVKRTADILLKYFPVVYDTARALKILGNDQQNKQLVVHAGMPETIPALALPAGKPVHVLDLSAGRFVATVGRAYDTMREETLDMMLALISAEPNLAPILGDLIVNEMQFPNKKAFVDRLQKALPPNLQDQTNPTDPNQLQAHNGMLMQQNQKLMASVQQLTQMMQTKQIENQSRERVEAMKLQASQILAQSRIDQENIKAQAAILTKKADAHFGAVHDHAMATKGAVHNLMQASHEAALAPAPAQPGLAPDNSGLTQ